MDKNDIKSIKMIRSDFSTPLDTEIFYNVNTGVFLKMIKYIQFI